ncbi:MAG: hypothetical protein KAT23_06510, partial [Anaerolineales bacterium]|nr:hypothetical protein [Anaerolineales bacterium]
MKRSRIWVPLTPLDWINLSTRALVLVAVPLVAGLYGCLSTSLIYLLTGWTVFTLLINLAQRGGWKPTWLERTEVVIDSGFAVATIGLSGLVESPLWWTLLIGPMRAGLYYGLPSILLTTGLSLIFAALMSVIFSRAGIWALIPVGIYTGTMMLAAAVVGVLEEQVRRRALFVEREQV